MNKELAWTAQITVDSFSSFFQKDGQIDADELQRCLTQSGIAGGYKRKYQVSLKVLILHILVEMITSMEIELF